MFPIVATVVLTTGPTTPPVVAPNMAINHWKCIFLLSTYMYFTYTFVWVLTCRQDLPLWLSPDARIHARYVCSSSSILAMQVAYMWRHSETSPFEISRHLWTSNIHCHSCCFSSAANLKIFTFKHSSISRWNLSMWTFQTIELSAYADKYSSMIAVQVDSLVTKVSTEDKNIDFNKLWRLA